MARWDIELTNKAGVVTGAIDAPSALKYTRRESDYCQLEFSTLDPHDLNIIALNPYKTKVKAWREKELVFWGDLADPLVVTQEGATVVAKDAFGRLTAPAHARYTWKDKTIKFIAEDLIGNETTYGARDIAFGSEAVTAQYDRQITKGQRMDEFLKNICTVNPTTGSWFRMDALDDPDNPSAMHFGDGGMRVDNPAARFEYGEGTLDNVSDFQIESRGVINRVYVWNNNQSVVVEDSDSIDDYGLHERWYRRPGANHVATLTAVAYAKLQPTPFRVASFTPTADAPKLFDDYDVGQICRGYFLLDGGSLVYHTDNMIPTVIEVTVDDSGVENVSFSEVSTRGRNQQPSSIDRWSRPRVEAVADWTATQT